MKHLEFPPLWDKDFVQKQHDIVLDYLKDNWNPEDNEQSMMADIMKKTRGQANPHVMHNIIKEFKD